MQLSLIEQFPEVKKCLFLDVFAKMSIDPRTKRPVLITLEGQRVPADFRIRCQKKAISIFPEGTVYKLDVRLIDIKNRKPYFSAVRNRGILRAIEFFDHNLKVQKGLLPRPKEKSKVVLLRCQP